MSLGIDQPGVGFGQITIELGNGDSRAVKVVAAFVLLVAVGSVVGSALVPERRGEDVRRAAAGALRAVSPPLVLAVVGLVALSISAAVAGVVLFIAIIAAIFGDEETAGNLFLLLIAGGAVVFLTFRRRPRLGTGRRRALRPRTPVAADRRFGHDL